MTSIGISPLAGKPTTAAAAPGIAPAQAPHAVTSATTRPQGNGGSGNSTARKPEKSPTERHDKRGAGQCKDSAMTDGLPLMDVLAKAELRSVGAGNIDYAAGLFAARYLERNPGTRSGDERPDADADDLDPAAAVSHADARQRDQHVVALRPQELAATFLAAEIVNVLAIMDKDGKRAVQMELKHAALPKTSVTLESTAERIKVVFESAEAKAQDLLGRETPRLAQSLAGRHDRACTVLVNTALPESRTLHRSHVERPSSPYALGAVAV